MNWDRMNDLLISSQAQVPLLLHLPWWVVLESNQAGAAAAGLQPVSGTVPPYYPKVPREGVEPSRAEAHQVLNLA